MESILLDFLQHRIVKDAVLLAAEKPLWEWVLLVGLGVGMGLAVMRCLVSAAGESERVSHSTVDKLENPDRPLSPSPVMAEPFMKPVADQKSAGSRVSPVVAMEDEVLIFHSDDEADSGNSEKDNFKRTVYLMDVSRSLSSAQFRRCQEDLISAIERLPHLAPYQVIFFAGAPWFAHQKMIEGGNKGERVVFQDGEKSLSWSYGMKEFRFENGNDDLPGGEWLLADDESKASTIKQIWEVKKSFGTTWHLPFKLAMNLRPAPEHIYFLTDGETKRQDVSDEIIGLVNAISEGTRVDTRGLDTSEDAEKHLSHISESTGGKFLPV